MPESHYQRNVESFEQATRQIRWLSIVVILATFPVHSLQAPFVYLLLALMSLYNASRYLTAVMRLPAFRSPVMSIIVDCLFVGVLVALVGQISTPYSGLFIFMIVSAAFIYQLPGAVAVTISEFILLALVSFWPPFPSSPLNQAQTITMTLFILLALGYLVARLTHTDRIERETLERLRAKSEQERRRLLTLLDSLSSAIFVTDSKGVIIQCNEAAMALTKKETLQGVEFGKLLHISRRDDPKNARVNVLKENASTQHRRDLCVLQADGTKIDLDVSVTQTQEDGVEAEFVIVCDDISQERSLDEQRAGFISVASHELRTPLSIVDAALSTALADTNDLPQVTRQTLEQAHRNVRHLSDVVKDLTILAAAQNDNVPVQVSRVEPSTLIDELMKDFETQAKQKGIKLTKHIEPGGPTIMSTEHHIREILQNFLTNALKYSSQGTVTITAAPTKVGGVLFSVQDEGIGISPSDQKLLFTKFFRAEDFRTRSTGGAGLGLYLCKELAQRLGGKVWCKSSLNKGSTFYLELPQQSNLRRDQGEVVRAQVANLVDDL